MLDYRSAFDLAPVGLVMSRNRLMLDCNQRLLEMFAATREALVGQSFEMLYPTAGEFERTGERIVASLGADGSYADERVMRRVGNAASAKAHMADAANGEVNGELFWCRVSGRALDPRHPHTEGIWSFEDLSARRPLRVQLTAREREIAALLIDGLTSKLIGRRLVISPRTVDIYRGRLMRKYGAATTAELVTRLLTA